MGLPAERFLRSFVLRLFSGMKVSLSGCQRKVRICEQIVVEYSGTWGCEQRYILNDFLSVDSGQALSG